MNHVLEQTPVAMADQLRFYSDPSVPLSPELVPALASFVDGLRSRR